MEDTYIAIPEIVAGVHLYAVFDGHAGANVSTYLKEYVPSFAQDALKKTTSLEEAVYGIFMRIIKYIPQDIAMHCGSTAVIMLQQGSKIVVANCGDSRAIMDAGNDAVPITIDHKPEREIERIQKAGGFVSTRPMDVPRVHGQLAVSRSIGDFYLFPSVTWKPEIFTVLASPTNTFIVMATDGIWDTVHNQEIIDIICTYTQKGKDINKACKIALPQILTVARARGSSDNVTILVIPIHQSYILSE